YRSPSAATAEKFDFYMIFFVPSRQTSCLYSVLYQNIKFNHNKKLENAIQEITSPVHQLDSFCYRKPPQSILLHTSITLINGNCNLLTHEEDSLFSIKWKYKRPFMDQEDEESTIKLLIDNISNDPKKTYPSLQCPNDFRALIDESNNINDHAYCQKNKKNHLIT
ncbi:THAP-type domain-containing protein, partial [Aphis craccivora]